MVADFVSADYSWLSSPSGKEHAWVLFKAGKNRKGYFTNEDILTQAEKAMDILEKHYPNEDHVLVFDNAKTHLKRADDGLSARHMWKTPSPSLEGNFGIWVNQKGLDGKPVYGPNGKVLKMKVQMEDATFADGQRQSLYFEPGHPQAGLFKGMSLLLQERGINCEANLRAECKNFQCLKDQTSCCVRRTLYNQPDFVWVESLLETACKAQGFEGIFLPQFHCELNFIEQCWGFAKRIYRHYQASSREADLERNVLLSLDSVPPTSMRRYEILNHPT